MKKFALVAVVATFGLMSCKKDYTCTCTGTNVPAGTSLKYTKVKKKDAESACSANQSTMVAGGYSDAKCSI